MRIHLILVLILIPILAGAQEARVVSCRLLGFQTGDSSVSLTCVADKNEVPCAFETSRISEPFNLFAVNQVLTFVDPKDKKTLCKVTVPAADRQVLIVFIPNASDSLAPWRAFTITDSRQGFPDGGALVVNLHKFPIRFVIGEHKYMLRPGEQHGMPMPKERDDFNMATVAFEFSHEEKWAKASESRQRFTEGLRYLIFAYTDPNSQRPRLSTYQDRPFQVASESTD